MISRVTYRDLVYVGTLIEYVARDTRNKRSTVMDCVGKRNLKEVFDTADVWHCLTYEQAVGEFKEFYCQSLPVGEFHIWKSTQDKPVEDPRVPAKMIPRMVVHLADSDENAFDLYWDIYHSWMEHDLFDFSDIVYWQSPEYHVACWFAGEWL